MKILFISFYNDEAQGIRILHSVLLNKGYDSKMLFFKLNNPRLPITNKERQLFIDYLKKENPDLLAFSLVSPNFNLYKSFYSDIRQQGNWKILIGGWQASLSPIETLNYSDFINVGEAEDSIVELVKCLERNRSPLGVLNIWYKDHERIMSQEVRMLNSNLSKYPVPIISNKYSAYIENNELVEKDPYIINTRYGVSISRGCPYSCTYCSNSAMKDIYMNKWSKIRYRTKEHVIKELKQVKEKMPNLKCINFYDEVFPIKLEWNKDFFETYKKEINIPFYCMFYPGTAREELIKIMKEAGLAGVWLGVQSGSERIRKEIYKRHYTNEKVLEQADVFSRYGISTKYDFIFNNPFETEDDVEKSLKLMAQLPEPKSFNMFSLKFFPKTEITTMALNNRIITKKDLDDQLDIESPVYTISKEKEQEYLNRIKIYESNFLNNRFCSPH